jgi:hypothetical protein
MNESTIWPPGRQLGGIHRDPPRLIFGEQLGRRAPLRLLNRE